MLNLDESQKLNDFNPNRGGERNRNPLFAKNNDRGGFNGSSRGMDRGRGEIRGGSNFSESRGGFSGDRGGRQFGNNQEREENRGNFGDNFRGGDFSGRGRNLGFNREFGGNRDFGGGNREFGNRDRNFGNNRNFGGRNRDFGGNRDRNFGGGNRDFGNFRGGGDRGRGRGRGNFYRGGRNFRGGRNDNNFYHDDMNRNYNEMEDNFNRVRHNHEEDDTEYLMKKEAQYEKEKFWIDFKKQYKEIIEGFKILFINEHLKDEEITQIILNVKSNPSLTIFEAMNYIYREVQIIKTLECVNSNNYREYGPNQDIFEQQNEQYYPKKNLNEVIQKYKIYHSEIENYQTLVPENYWLYYDDSDRRRPLIKDESDFFNYLPILNPNKKYNNNSDNNEKDPYAKNENEILYHYLFFKTLMCKQCDLTDESNQENDLCPYAHNILKDFRIIYDYKNEDTCKFMKKLLESNLFSFVDYLNYIPMSLSPEFNLDTFKVHKCQLDKSCPNDYHLCPYYHNSVKGDDKRRPPLLFCYSGGTGDICFDERKKKYCPEKCICGIFCNFLHNKNEYNYHPEHFQKEYKCKRPKFKGKCIYEKTCYGIHGNSSDEEEEEAEEEEDDDDEEVKEEDIKNDKNIEEIKTKVKNTFTVAKIFRCRKCQYVPENGELCFFNDCSHFMCIKCFKKMNVQFKRKKKNKESASSMLQCPFCEKELKNKGLTKALFNS